MRKLGKIKKNLHAHSKTKDFLMTISPFSYDHNNVVITYGNVQIQLSSNVKENQKYNHLFPIFLYGCCTSIHTHNIQNLVSSMLKLNVYFRKISPFVMETSLTYNSIITLILPSC